MPRHPANVNPNRSPRYGPVSPSPSDADAAGSLTIRPPLQRRSREAWNRVLDAGVALLEEGGYEAFTIAALCERAGVPPRAVYDRADSKAALFLAVYEHGTTRVRADHERLTDHSRWDGMTADALAREAVREVAGIFARHAAFLRAVILISGVHPEVNRRGSSNAHELAGQFADLLLARVGEQIAHPDPEAAIRRAFDVVFSTLVMRVAFGPGFVSPETDDETFLDGLAVMVSGYLFTNPARAATSTSPSRARRDEM
jgi:AcrR family transcriptional regulator